MKRSELPFFKKHALKLYENEPPEGYADNNKKWLSSFGREIAEELQELESVDMSVLANSGIDCVFGDKLKRIDDVGYLRGVLDANNYECDDLTTWVFCKPRMNYWFSVLNFDDPLGLTSRLKEAGFKVLIMPLMPQINGMRLDQAASFKITGLQDGYCYPWEVKK